MTRIAVITFFIPVVLSQNVLYENSPEQIQLYSTKLFPNAFVPLIHPVAQIQYLPDQHIAKPAEEKYLKTGHFSGGKKRKKFKLLKKQFKKCLFPRRFRIIRKSDNGINQDDTINIQVPDNFEYEDRDDFTKNSTDSGKIEDDYETDYDHDDSEKDGEVNYNYTSTTLSALPHKNIRTVQQPKSHLMIPKMGYPVLRPINSLPRRYSLQPSQMLRPRVFARPKPLSYHQPYPPFMNRNQQINYFSKLRSPIFHSLQKQTQTYPPRQSFENVNNFVSQNYKKTTPSSTIRYSQPDYSIHGSYTDLTNERNYLQSSTSGHVNKTKKEEEIFTVTAKSVWGVNPIYVPEENDVRTMLQNKTVEIKTVSNNSTLMAHNIRRVDGRTTPRNIFPTNSWIPLKKPKLK